MIKSTQAPKPAFVGAQELWSTKCFSSLPARQYMFSRRSPMIDAGLGGKPVEEKEEENIFSYAILYLQIQSCPAPQWHMVARKSQFLNCWIPISFCWASSENRKLVEAWPRHTFIRSSRPSTEATKQSASLPPPIYLTAMGKKWKNWNFLRKLPRGRRMGTFVPPSEEPLTSKICRESVSTFISWCSDAQT